jgi:hypothetical protein
MVGMWKTLVRQGENTIFSLRSIMVLLSGIRPAKKSSIAGSTDCVDAVVSEDVRSIRQQQQHSHPWQNTN